MAIFMANVDSVGYRIDTQKRYVQIPGNDLLQVLHNFRRSRERELVEESYLGFTVHPRQIKNRLDSRHYDPRILKAVNDLESRPHVRLGDISYPFIEGRAPRLYARSGVPVVTIGNIVKRNGFYFVDLTDVKYITEEAHEKASESTIGPGDILLAITGATIGKVAVVPKYLPEGNICGDILRVRLRQGLNPYYVAVFLSTKHGQLQIFKHIYGSTNMHLDTEGMKSAIITTCADQEEVGRKMELVEDGLHKASELLSQLGNIELLQGV